MQAGKVWVYDTKCEVCGDRFLESSENWSLFSCFGANLAFRNIRVATGVQEGDALVRGKGLVAAGMWYEQIEAKVRDRDDLREMGGNLWV